MQSHHISSKLAMFIYFNTSKEKWLQLNNGFVIGFFFIDLLIERTPKKKT